MKVFTKDEVLEAHKAAPAKARSAFRSEKVLELTNDLHSRYTLTSQVKDQLGKEIGYLLLALTTPKEFFDRLTELGNERSTTENILADIHRTIIVPMGEGAFDAKGEDEGFENEQEEVLLSAEQSLLPAVQQKSEAAPFKENVSAAPYAQPAVTPRPPAPNTTPLVKAYVADPYREPME